MKNVIKVAIAFTVLPTAAAVAQQSATQKFTVTVPTNISITAPADATLTHDESDNDQTFAAQQWQVFGNGQAGVSVTFSTATPFIHTTLPSFERDAELGLALNSNTGPAAWSIDTATDVTDYANGDDVATVAASSDGVGRGTFDLSVKFITDTFGSFASGDYETTVTGTVTSN